MPPSFSRFRGHDAVPKRPRTPIRKPLQPKVFVPANSGTGLPQPVDVPPDIFHFPEPDDLVHAIAFPNDPVAVAGVVGVPETDILSPIPNDHVDRPRIVGATTFVSEHLQNSPAFTTPQLHAKPEAVTQIIPRQIREQEQQQQQHHRQQQALQQQPRTPPPPPPDVRRRSSGVLPQASRAPWLLYEDRLLTILTTRYPDNWELVSAHFSDRSAIQLQRRWHDHLKLSRKWTHEETSTIRKLQLRHPNDWTHISSTLRSRTPASVRYHWFYDMCREPEYS